MFWGRPACRAVLAAACRADRWKHPQRTCSALNDSVRPFSLQNCKMTLMTLQAPRTQQQQRHMSKVAPTTALSACVCPPCSPRRRRRLQHALCGLNLQRHDELLLLLLVKAAAGQLQG